MFLNMAASARGRSYSQEIVPMKTAKKVRCKKSPPAWHDAFVAMVPAIETHAKIVFRRLDAEAREEAVQEVICNACCAYARLVELKKTEVAYPSVLARFGVAQTKDGRKVGGQLNCRDVLSNYCQRKKDLLVERLDRFDSEEDAWDEILVEDRHAGPAETAIARIDFVTWLQLLPRRLRKIARFLANGETTSTGGENSCRKVQNVVTDSLVKLRCWQPESGSFTLARHVGKVPDLRGQIVRPLDFIRQGAEHRSDHLNSNQFCGIII